MAKKQLTTKTNMINKKFNHLDESKLIFQIEKIIKKGAVSRNIEYNLPPEDLKNYIFKNCYYCENPPKNTLKYGKRILKWNGLDRIDSLKSYSKENIVPCCITCNKAKSNMKIGEFKMWVQQIYNIFGRKNDDVC